ncbi:MAG: hypothetical protein AB7E83_27635, partial [Ramlibacter sp.]
MFPALLAGIGLLCAAGPSAAQAVPSTPSAAVLPAILGPEAPEAPEVVTRDAQGNATVRATRLPAPLRMDGRLDEPMYGVVRAVSGTIQ